MLVICHLIGKMGPQKLYWCRDRRKDSRNSRLRSNRAGRSSARQPICPQFLLWVWRYSFAQVVASCAKAMGMTVIGYDPVMGKETLFEAGIAHASLADIYKNSDFITVFLLVNFCFILPHIRHLSTLKVHTPLTPETTNLLNDETLGRFLVCNLLCCFFVMAIYFFSTGLSHLRLLLDSRLILSTAKLNASQGFG